ncbi:MAG: type II secretion system protein [Fibrella sp.]|nr:type II secretion system protein [Armatimonadota bacterium]
MNTNYNNRNHCNQRGFTLIEIMVVILVIGLLLTIAVPNFLKAREKARKNACVNNLRKIDWAKDCFLMDNNKDRDTLIGEADIYPPNGISYLKTIPKCDSGGDYTIGSGSESPTCSYGNGHVENANQ